MISTFLNLWRTVSWLNIWYILENVSCTLKKKGWDYAIKNIKFIAIGWSVGMSVRLIYSEVFSSIFFLCLYSVWFLFITKWNILLLYAAVSVFSSSMLVSYISMAMENVRYMCLCNCFFYMTWLTLVLPVSGGSFYLKVYFVWCNYGFLCSPWVLFCMK